MPNGNFLQRQPALIMLSGLPGSGKTTFARALCQALAAEHVESDAIRRAIASQPAYTPREHARVFAIAEQRVAAALSGGRVAVLDATNLTRRDRRRFFQLAGQHASALIAVRVTVPDEVARQRLAGTREGFSQAGVAVFDQMRSRVQSFTVPVVVVDGRHPPAPAIALILRLLEASPPGEAPPATGE